MSLESECASVWSYVLIFIKRKKATKKKQKFQSHRSTNCYSYAQIISTSVLWFRNLCRLQEQHAFMGMFFPVYYRSQQRIIRTAHATQQLKIHCLWPRPCRQSRGGRFSCVRCVYLSVWHFIKLHTAIECVKAGRHLLSVCVFPHEVGRFTRMLLLNSYYA